MITTKLSVDKPTLPPMHHEPEDATGAFQLREGSNLPTTLVHHILQRTARNV